MLQVPSVTHGYPTVTSGVLTKIIHRHSDRAPIEFMASNPMPSLLFAFATVNATPPAAKTNIVCGKICARNQPTVALDLFMQTAEMPLPVENTKMLVH